MSYHPITDLDGLSPEHAKRLKAVGIRTTARLLEEACSLRGRIALAAKTAISEKQLLAWANMANHMRIKGIGNDNAKLLQAAGVKTVEQLRYRSPGKLAKAMALANAKRKLVRNLPTEKAIERWISDAAKLDGPKITY
jgi:predicted flap endonuclease-1-like 5' DNA nuclease